MTALIGETILDPSEPKTQAVFEQLMSLPEPSRADWLEAQELDERMRAKVIEMWRLAKETTLGDGPQRGHDDDGFGHRRRGTRGAAQCYRSLSHHPARGEGRHGCGLPCRARGSVQHASRTENDAQRP